MKVKAELDYGRGPEKTWVYGGLRVRDGQQVTMTATSRNSVFYQQFLQKLETSNPAGDIYVITDNLSSHNSLSTRAWLEDHPRIKHIFIPVGACWLNLQEAWWRILRKDASKIRTGHVPANMATLRNLSIDILRDGGRHNIAAKLREVSYTPFTHPLDLLGLT
ncbi:transposase [Streptomyces sp. NPDC098789]|uniref:transposase n=1 Tax=Streptomyces sp. NPDC098789 TaxID=3366098 RepID=UPI0037F838E1